MIASIPEVSPFDAADNAKITKNNNAVITITIIKSLSKLLIYSSP